jgi:hypothetical protein
MLQNQKELSLVSQKGVGVYVIEIKCVSKLTGAGNQKTRGEKMKVSSIMLLKTHVEKMSESGLSTMLLKNKIVGHSLPLYD